MFFYWLYLMDVLFDVFDRFSSSVKEINRLVNKRMYVLLLDVFNGCSLVQLKK